MEVHDPSSLDALLAELHDESRQPTRFPARLMLVTGIDVWRPLVQALSSQCEVVRLSAFCEDDKVPSIFDVTQGLAPLAGRSVLLVPLGELLRLMPSSQAAYLDFLLSLEEPGYGRLYVPILDNGGLIGAEVERHRHYAAYSPPVWRLNGNGSARIDFAPLAVKTERSEILRGLRAYLRAWEQADLTSALVVTSIAEHLEPSDGVVSTRVYRTAFDVVRSYVAGGDALNQDMGTTEQWQWLAAEVMQGESLSVPASRLLNVRGYDERQLYAMWRNRTDNERWLTWLWSRQGEGTHRLSERVARQAARPVDMGYSAAMLPLEGGVALDDIAARRQLLLDLGVPELPAQFWERLQQVADPLRRLQCLPGLSPTCCVHIVRAAGNLLAEGVPLDAWLPILRVTYPELAAYLTPPPVDDEQLQAYLRVYTHARVCDRPTHELEEMSEAWARGGHLWNARTRAALLDDMRATDVRVVWVDALGIEWLGMLCELLAHKDLALELRYGRCNLPSITSVNADWPPGTDIDRNLDQWAHSYTYSFPRTFVQQLEFVARLVDRVATLCGSSGTVIVTSDHGLTRFAAEGERVDPPPGYTSHKWGRFAEPDAPGAVDSPGGEWLVDGNRLILARHGLFRGGSRVTGEVHGGATPEEGLVPVLRVSARQGQALPTFSLPERTVRVDAAGRGKLTLLVSGPAASLHIVLAARSIQGQLGDRSEWDFVLHDVSPGKHTIHVYCALRYLGATEIEVVRGIQERDLGL